MYRDAPGLPSRTPLTGKWLVLLRGMSLGPWGKRTKMPLMDKAIRKGFMEEVAFALGLDG